MAAKITPMIIFSIGSSSSCSCSSCSTHMCPRHFYLFKPSALLPANTHEQSIHLRKYFYINFLVVFPVIEILLALLCSRFKGAKTGNHKAKWQLLAYLLNELLTMFDSKSLCQWFCNVIWDEALHPEAAEVSGTCVFWWWFRAKRRVYLHHPLCLSIKPICYL